MDTEKGELISPIPDAADKLVTAVDCLIEADRHLNELIKAEGLTDFSNSENRQLRAIAKQLANLTERACTLIPEEISEAAMLDDKIQPLGIETEPIPTARQIVTLLNGSSGDDHTERTPIDAAASAPNHVLTTGIPTSMDVLTDSIRPIDPAEITSVTDTEEKSRDGDVLMQEGPTVIEDLEPEAAPLHDLAQLFEEPAYEPSTEKTYDSRFLRKAIDLSMWDRKSEITSEDRATAQNIVETLAELDPISRDLIELFYGICGDKYDLSFLSARYMTTPMEISNRLCKIRRGIKEKLGISMFPHKALLELASDERQQLPRAV